MRKLLVSEFISLDGVMQAPGGVFEDRDGGFIRGGWTWPYWHDDIGSALFGPFQSADTLLLGRKTYIIHGRAFEPMPMGDPFGDVMKSLKKVVVSKTLTDLFWRNSTRIDGTTNMIEEVRKLKQQPGKDILVDGSHELVHALLAADLVDQLMLLVYPVILGQGKQLMPPGVHLPFKLLSSKATPTGVIINHYARAGAKPNFTPPRIETRPEMHLIGIERRVRGGDPSIPKIWDEFAPRMSELPQPKTAYGLMTDMAEDGMMNYMAGAPAPAGTQPPPGMIARSVPAQRYAALDTRIPELHEAFGHMHGACIPALEVKPAQGPALEEYGPDFRPDHPVLTILVPIQ